MNNLIRYSAISDCGKIRKQNQDRIFLNDSSQKDNQFFEIDGVIVANGLTAAIFDGMGGELEGDKAAEIAADILRENIDSDLEKICRIINKKICDYMDENCITKMGTTAAIVRINGDYAEICNIGDSKIFLIKDDAAKQISVDHTVTIGELMPRRVLTQYLGIPETEILIEPYCRKEKFDCGDILLLCSDGLTDMVSERDIFKIVKQTEIQLCAKALYDAAMLNGGRDNISIIICEKE